jgi:hypothetical protein
MATNVRVVVSHLDANGKTLTHWASEQYLLTVATVDQNGITSVLSSNSKKRGNTIQVHSYAILDPQYNSATLLWL